MAFWLYLKVCRHWTELGWASPGREQAGNSQTLCPRPSSVGAPTHPWARCFLAASVVLPPPLSSDLMPHCWPYIVGAGALLWLLLALHHSHSRPATAIYPRLWPPVLPLLLVLGLQLVPGHAAPWPVHPGLHLTLSSADLWVVFHDICPHCSFLFSPAHLLFSGLQVSSLAMNGSVS